MTLDKDTNDALRAKFNPEGSQLRQVQMRLLEMLQRFDEYCRRHGVKYWLSSGTCLGAMRHGGFIPWDDDVDVEMEYGDYKRLLKLLRSHPIEGYILQDKHSDEEYVLNFAKLRDLHSNIEEYAGQDAHWQFRGCYIDIFPLLPSSSLWLHKRGLNIHNRLVHRHMRVEDERVRRFKITAGRRVFDYLAFPILRLLGSIGAGRCRRHIPGGAYHFRRDADDFRELRYVDFEGVSLPVPGDADAYLTRIYGDWRDIPDPDKIEVHIRRVTLD